MGQICIEMFATLDLVGQAPGAGGVARVAVAVAVAPLVWSRSCPRTGSGRTVAHAAQSGLDLDRLVTVPLRPETSPVRGLPHGSRASGSPPSCSCTCCSGRLPSVLCASAWTVSNCSSIDGADASRMSSPAM